MVGYGLGFRAGSLSPVCREGSHDDVDDDGDEVFNSVDPPRFASMKNERAHCGVLYE